ncbi:NFX1-type zinc finger-containing protein 1 [Seminavis robusta]|uniref:NFX1-type zinc finger-containing protein 1 n=1 Tax=Seminavis robusta TaxID=568900 RepID=A0A9N8DU15_9STRA|nr:NFX1-type zinc finger-containing protein 1 [Seminavis robusta]|eukprot:Sro371_g128570.1 NFX1-type zinc finger-containing protein 1 (3720) ;mRNA; f:28484-40825
MDKATIRLLIVVLTRIPGSSAADPPPIVACEAVIGKYLSEETKASASDEAVLTAVKTVSDAVKRLLGFEWQASRDDVHEFLSNVILLAEGSLRKKRKEHRLVGSSLEEILDDLEKPWRIQTRSKASAADNTLGDETNSAELSDYSAWKTANIKWLGEPTFFAPACCPVMKIGPNGVYENPEEYMQTVLRLWIAMTFFGGFSAIAPRCRTRGQSGICSSALWPVGSSCSTGNMTCRRSGCRRPVLFACSRNKSHDALCEQCANQAISDHIGPPSPRAATHIYDATVLRVRSDGVVYFKNFQSRNPPPSIHWRSTKRLSPANLVGIVLLDSRRSCLSSSDPIVWGEVVCHGDSRNESHRREKGEVAVNLASIVEFDVDSLAEDGSVAIIDAMTFVPEWIPVLRALENQQATRLPFDSGRYLNLWKTNPVETFNSIMDSSASADQVFAEDKRVLISQMIRESELEPIREIRRDAQLTEQLVEQLEALVIKTTLDKMQLIAFIDSLRNCVHLTQGPPGTGKSYLGVALVQALVLIRTLWLKKTKTVGTPPILVLSYKNHAIDEFCVDIVNALGAYSLRNKMIRIGGQCKDPRLSAFSERNAYQSDVEVKNRRKIFDRLDTLKQSLDITIEGKASSFLSFRHAMFAPNEDSSNPDSDAKARRKAAIEATKILMDSIGRWDLLRETLKKFEELKDSNPKEAANSFAFLELDATGEESSLLKDHMSAFVCGCTMRDSKKGGSLLLCETPLRSSQLTILLKIDHLHLHRSSAFPKVSSNSYVVDDEEEDENMPLFVEPATKTCLERTRKGKPCKGVVLPGQQFCYDHAPPEQLSLEAERRTAVNVGQETDHGQDDHNEETKKRKKNDDDVEEEAVENPKLKKEKMSIAEKRKVQPMEDANDNKQLQEKSTKKAKKDEKEPASSPLPDTEEDAMSFHSAGSEIVDDADVDRLEPDEVEFDEEEGDNLQHLRDVFEITDGAEDNLEDVENLEDDVASATASESLANPTADGIDDQAPSLPADWCWDWTIEERWNACYTFMQVLQELLRKASQQTREAIKVARKDLRKAEVQAKARVYENRSIIAGTMVGCIHRLEAIRTTKPFAVVVEEASEVCEPLLFSCLTESTVKLEMIGDHRQLQPSVQDRFEFEQCNKVNVSMFQRLIEAPAGHGIPSTVLSVQRRMRTNICDLTRSFYLDVTEIEDHETVHSQVIGQRDSGPQKLIPSTATQGREVPGIGPHVFLWTHKGEQKKSHVGVSRINPVEAEMVCSLVAYLVGCGVPRPSIAVLTPYKGQLMLIRKMISSDRRYSSQRLLAGRSGGTDEIRISTVDRFQGDEEDIIICSLVVDEKSKTGFVKLQNRMIVLLSRARLGLYILGNTGYFEGKNMPRHWADTFGLLQQPSTSDSNGSPGDQQHEEEKPRTGSELPLCCPVHRQSRSTAKNAADLKLGFCEEVCQHKLRCSHTCALPCHWPSNDHKKMCPVPLDSPCTRHQGEITCHHLLTNAPGTMDATTAINAYRCPQEGASTLPCGHCVQLACWKHDKMTSGEIPWPNCDLPSPVSYTFQDCDHTLSVTCRQLRDFTADPNKVKCKEDVEYHPPCGHPEKMKCWQQTQYESGVRKYDCLRKQEVILPRCGHEHLLPCNVAQALRNWTGKSIDEVGKVVEGEQYGPQDYTCHKQVVLVRTCGHEQKMQCNDAFRKSDKLGPCAEIVHRAHPGCGHQVEIQCQFLSALDGLKPPTPSVEIIEGTTQQPSPLPPGVPKCQVDVELVRKCGHKQPMKCWRARHPKVGCEQLLQAKSPLCSHVLEIPCRVRGELSEPLWSQQQFEEIRNSKTIQHSFAHECNVETASTSLKKCLATCRGTISLTLPCSHTRQVLCKELPKTLRERTYRCDEKAEIKLKDCGHTAEVSCSKAKEYLAGNASIPCKEIGSKACWNYAHCGVTLKAKCGLQGLVACKDPTAWTCPSKKHSYQIKQCTEGSPLSCPGCAMDALDEAIKAEAFTPSEVLEAYLAMVPSECIQMLRPKPAKYMEKESDMLAATKVFLTRLQIWERPLCRLQRIPCFRVLRDSSHTGLDWFDPVKLAKRKTAEGILTALWTRDSFLWLASTMKSDDEEVLLLCGVASVARTLLSPMEQFPQKKNLTKLMKKMQNEVFDSLVFTEQNGCCRLVVCYPFPLVSVCRIRLKRSDVEQIVSCLDGLEPINFDLEKVQRETVPSNLLQSVPAAPPPPQKTDDVEDQSVSSNESSQGHNLEGTALAGFVIDRDLSMDCIPESVQSDLRNKMKFSNANATPFAGIKLLRTLSSSTKITTPLLNLLFAAEFINGDRTQAAQYLRYYLTAVDADDKGSHRKVHPWTLIVASRLEHVGIGCARLLRLFLSLFPSEKHMLTEAEQEMALDESDDEMSVATDDASGISVDPLVAQWSDLQSAHPGYVQSDAMDELLAMTGLKKVKVEAIQLWERALQVRKMDPETRKRNAVSANYVFLGNPGTGKTTVARSFARILHDSGFRENDVFVETTAQLVKEGGMDEFKKDVSKAMGGTLFIDEAYDIDPVNDYKGKPIANHILTLCENERDNLSLILAGYEDDFQERFYKYNPGLKSRFREITFDDFDEEELTRIWTDMRSNKRWSEADNVCTVMVKRLMKQSGKKGFGNARDVRNHLENATKSAMSRLGDNFDQDNMQLEVVDVIGEDPRLSSGKLLAVTSEIDEKIGWHRVKAAVQELLELCSTNYQRELLGKTPLAMVMNRLVLGNPGTGKTTFAKLYGRLLKELGFLSNGDVVSKTASDFVGSHIGESQTKTNSILEMAKGKVLIIDECYALDDQNFGKQVLDTLVEKVQGSAFDDIAVLLLGYEEPVMKMIKGQNPGLKRRFPVEHAFYFDDYNDDELLAILELNLKKQGVQATFGFREKALDVLQLQKGQSGFGNAGSVELIVKGATTKAAKRGTASPDLMLTEDDIENAGANRADKDANPLDKLDTLFKVDKIRAKLEEMQKSLIVAKREGSEKPELGHFVFRGSPGTGKTTLARVIADVLFSLELKPSNKLVEKSAQDLTADYVGQTTTKVKEALTEAKGGVLFVDEAYSLGEGPFGKDAVDTIVQAMTSEEFADVLIIIAGYPDEINDMLNTNVGLKSRFTNFFDFPNWEASDCITFFKKCLEKESFSADNDVLEKLEEGCMVLSALEGWGNGRDMMQLWKEAKSQRASRVFDKTDDFEKVIVVSDVAVGVDAMIQGRIPGSTVLPDNDVEPLEKLCKLYRMEGIKSKLEQMKKAWAVARREGNVVGKLGNFVFKGSPGTGKTTVARVIADVLFGLKLKPSNKIVEKPAMDLIAGYVGQTAGLVTKALKEAKGGILFIDEAYDLCRGGFGVEAVNTLVAAMTSDDYADVTIIIAGYPLEIDQMLRSNAGLKSRFKHYFDFPDWVATDCIQFLNLCAVNDGFTIDDETLRKLQPGFEELRNLDGWANGRDVQQMWEGCLQQRAERVFDLPESDKHILADDAAPALLEMLHSRREIGGKSRVSFPTSLDQLMQEASGAPPPAPSPPSQAVADSTNNRPSANTRESVQKQQKANVELDESDEQTEEAIDVSDDSGRDEGVPDDVWAELQAAKEAERQREMQEEEERKAYEAWLQEQERLEEEARRRYEEELERLRRELEKQELERAIREAEEAERKRQQAIEAERRRREAEARRRQEEQRRREETQRRLQQINPCPAGFTWYKQGGGWRCCGGSHFVSDKELRSRFSSDM